MAARTDMTMAVLWVAASAALRVVLWDANLVADLVAETAVSLVEPTVCLTAELTDSHLAVKKVSLRATMLVVR